MAQVQQPQATSLAVSEPLSDPALEKQKEQRQINNWIYITFAGGMLLVCSFVAQILWDSKEHAALLGMMAALLLGSKLVFDAVGELLQGKAGLNSLVALAVAAAFAIGSYQESAAIAFFLILAQLIESRTAVGAQASIESLIKITPTRAHKLVDGKEVETEAKDLVPGDVVRVRPGDNIPADGTIVRGESTVNQANITGESLPVDKALGDQVFGGTINMTGLMEIQVTKAGSDTTLGRVKELILQAEETRIPIMRMVDRYANWYVPTVLMIVGIVLFFNLRSDPDDAFRAAIAMLVSACPVAIILATPTAMVASLSAAARLGVLIKSVLTLEAARNLTAIVFDKTGTLTTGVLSVTRLTPAPGVEGAALLKAAASAEQSSRHPVARAVSEVARKAKLNLAQPTEFEEVAGKGVRAVVNGQEILVGRASWLSDPKHGLPTAAVAAARKAQQSPETEGLSVLFVVKDKTLLGWIGLEDNPREEAPAAVDRLHDLGMKRLIILTGDRESVAKRIAAQMHMDEYKAEVLPEQKLEMVDHLKEKGHRVAVVGDGVNDAPALAAGDISIAMGAAGSDVAIHSASIALMNNNLNRIPFLIDLSRHTISVIRQNLIIGAVFIVTFMSLAAAGYVPPILAAALHVVSGLIVIFNSARLVRSGEAIEHAEAEALADRTAKVKKQQVRQAAAQQPSQVRQRPVATAPQA